MSQTAVSPSPVKTAREAEEKGYRQPPGNIEAEQALLGAILVNNEAMHYVGDALRPEHFYEPVHGRIFEAIQKFWDRGLIANPVTLKHYFEQDQALADIGGGQYLAKLAAAAATVINVSDYGKLLYDLALKRQLIDIGSEMVNTAYDAEMDHEAPQQIEAAEQKLFNLATEGSGQKSFKPLRQSLAQAITRAETAYKNSGKLVGVTTGLKDLDRLLGGMQRSDLIILAGRPSMGKTALATTIAYNAAQAFHDDAVERGEEGQMKAVGFFSLEMSSEQLATRLLASKCGINSSKLLKGELTKDEFPKLVTGSNELAALKLFIDDTPALSISALRTRARRLKRLHNLGLIVVDYLQLVRGSSQGREQNRVLEISEITQGLKAIAKELDVPVMALSQLSRAVEQREDKRPQLSDLRESGTIEQDSDVVMFVFREEYYHMRRQPREGTPEYGTWQEEMDKLLGLAEVIIAKQRNGPIGNVLMQFQSDLTRFEDLARDGHLPTRYDQ